MAVRKIEFERLSVASSNSFENILAAIEAAAGHPEMTAFREDMAAARTYAEFKKVVEPAIGPCRLTELIRFDLGTILRKQQESEGRRNQRLVIGNPSVRMQMTVQVPDAGSYGPVTVLIDERSAGVRLVYDRVASLLAPYENQEAFEVAHDLDAKVEFLLTRAAGEK